MKPRDNIDRFMVLKKLSTGAMASVYLGLDTLNDTLVSIKLLFPELLLDETAVKRFRREGSILKRLQHPSVVKLIESGSDKDQPFMVLEQVRGTSLAQLIRTHGRFQLPQALKITKDLACTLAEAHAQNIVHRNITPNTLLIEDKSGTLKVLDFGVARAADRDLKTSVGTFLGTLTYASPEQMQGIDVDGRADLYALGLVMYQMLTGKHAIIGTTDETVLEQQLADSYLPPSRHHADIPHGLDPLVLRLLRGDRLMRYARVDDFLRDLEVFESQEQVRSLSSKHVNADPELAADYRKATELLERRELDAALLLIERLGRRAPQAAEVAFLLGEVQVERGLVYKAIQAYSKATALEPDNVHYHVALGLAYEKLDMRSPARAEYATALELDPQSAIAREQLEALDVRIARGDTDGGSKSKIATKSIGGDAAQKQWAGTDEKAGEEVARWKPQVTPRWKILANTLVWWGWAADATGQHRRAGRITRLQSVLAVIVVAYAGLYTYSRRHGMPLLLPHYNPLAYPTEVGCTLFALYCLGAVYFLEEALRSFDRLELQGRVVSQRPDRKLMTINLGSEHGVRETSVFNIYREAAQGSCRGTLLGRMLVQEIRSGTCSGSYMQIAEDQPHCGDYAVALETVTAGLLDPETMPRHAVLN